MTKTYLAKIPLVLKNDKGEDFRVAEGEAVTLTEAQYAQLSEYVIEGEAADPATAAAIAEASADAPAVTEPDAPVDPVGADGAADKAENNPPDVAAKTTAATAKRGQKAEA